MPRVKTGTTRRRRHKKILKATKGYWGARSRLYKTAHEAYLHAGEYAYAGRKMRKRDFRRLWIQRINAALKPHDVRYSQFINQLNKAEIKINRKMLADLALHHNDAFGKVVETAKKVK